MDVPTTAKRGLLRPFGFDRQRDLATVTGIDLLEARIQQALGFDGELPWAPERTSNLDKLRNQRNATALRGFARFYCRETLGRMVPQVLVIDVMPIRNCRTLKLQLKWEPRDKSAPARQTTVSV